MQKSDFYEKINETKRKYAQYRETYNVQANSTAYMKRRDCREPANMIQERAKLFVDLKHAIHMGREIGLSYEDITNALNDKNINVRYIRKAIMRVKKEENLEKEHNLDKEERSLEREIAIEKINREFDREKEQEQEDQKRNQDQERDNEFTIRAQLETLRKDEARYKIEKAMHEGFDQRELTAIASTVGIEQTEAKSLVEEIVDQEEERWFITGEQREMEEYAEEELEMTHTL